MAYFRNCVYFVQYRKDMPIKIGYTKSWADRREAFKTWCPYPVKPLKVIRASRRIEQLLHNLFKEFNTNGEWFENNEKILSFINNCPVDDVHKLENLIKIAFKEKADKKRIEDNKDLENTILDKPKTILRKKVEEEY